MKSGRLVLRYRKKLPPNWAKRRNLRPLLLVSKSVNPKALGLFVDALRARG